MVLTLFVIWIVITALLNFGNVRWSMGRSFRGWIADIIWGGLVLMIAVTVYRWTVWVFS